MQLKWFKLYAEIRTDPKMEMLDDQQFRVWIHLLCLASDSSCRGIVSLGPGHPYPDEILAKALRCERNALRNVTLPLLVTLRMIEETEDGIVIVNFDERQGENAERLREINRQRQARFREKKRNDSNALRVTLRNATDKTRQDKIRLDYSVASELSFEAGTTNQVDIETVQEFLDWGIEPEAIRHGIEVMRTKGKRFNFLKGILKNWKADGIKTLQQAKAENKPQEPSSPRYRPAREVLKEQGIDI